MSYILEALRKSERERRTGEVPALPALVANPPPQRRSWAIWLVAALLLFNAAGLSYLWMNRRAPNSAPAGGPAPGSMRPQADAPPTTSAAAADVAPSAAIVHPAPPPAARPEAPAPAKPPAQPPEARPAMAANPPPAARPTPKPVARPESAPARTDGRPSPLGINQQSEEKGKAPDEAPVPVKSKRPVAARPPASILAPQGSSADDEGSDGRKSDSRDDIPVLRAMPMEFRQRIPEFRINVHAYSKAPSERFAIIDMKKYLVGDRLPGGALLREIREDSLVLELDGSKFRVPRP
jgi:general secretion pathway protein B